MSQREQKRELKAKKAALRRELAARREASPLGQRARRRKQVIRVLFLIALIVVLLLLRCECQPGPLPLPAPVVASDAGVQMPKPKVATKKLSPITGDDRSLGRPGYDGPTAPRASWLDDFRLQVAARSTRLAKCFQGTERPGALKWSTSVNLTTGVVSEHELTPVTPGAEVNAEQRSCLVEGLSKPPYVFDRVPADALPDRVSLVIEF